MATHIENIENEKQEWDMEFKDPFSLEEDELSVYCSGHTGQMADTRTSCCLEGHSAGGTLSGGLIQKINTAVTSSLPTITSDHKTGPTNVELPNWKENSQQRETEVEANRHSSVSVDGGNGTHPVNEPVTSYGRRLSHDTNVELNSSEVTPASSEQQSPIPVMLSSTKRFYASEDIQSSKVAKLDSAYFRLPPPSALLNTPPARFAQPVYPPTAYNIPAWPAVSLPLPMNNSGMRLQVPPVVPYNNCVPYSAILPHSTNLSTLYNQSHIPGVEGTGASHWPGARLHLPNMLSQPPPRLPDVTHAAVLGLPAGNFAALPHLQNGLTLHRLPLAAVPHIFPPFPVPPPNIKREQFSTSPRHSVLLPQKGQQHNAVKSGLPVVSNANISPGQILPHYSVGAKQPEPSSTNAGDVTACLSSSAVLKCNNNNTECYNKCLMSNNKTLPSTEHLRTTLAITSSTSEATKQTAATATSCSSTPSPPVKFSSPFAQLDPRIQNGPRQNSGAVAQSRSSAVATSTASSAFVVPVPPPLPSLKELTADSVEDPADSIEDPEKKMMSDVKDIEHDEAAILDLSFQSTASGTTTASDSPKLDEVIRTNKC